MLYISLLIEKTKTISFNHFYNLEFNGIIYFILCRVPNLIENHEYDFRVAAVNAAGQGPWSLPSDAIPCRAPPSAPKITSDLSIRDMTVIAGHEFTITVPFTGNPKPTPTWIINGVEVTPDDRIKFEVNNNSTIFLNKCAKRNEAGAYTIVLKNSEGTDSASCRVLVVDRPSPPQGPLEVSDISPDTCTLAWKSPLDDGGSPITNYVVEKLDANGLWTKVSSFVRGNHYEVMGLEANKKYYFRVRAENQYGLSDPLALEEPVLATYPFTVPDPPGAPKVIDWDSSNVKLIWDRPRSDGGARIQGYQIEYRDVSDAAWQTNDILVRDNTYQVYNLSSGREYEFRVRAKNAAGFSKPSPPSSKFKLKGKFNVPSPPGMPTAVKIGKNYVDLKWDRPTSDGGSRITGYIVERRDVGGSVWVPCNDYNIQGTEFTVPNLSEGSDYEFRIIAVNAVGKSDPSPSTIPITTCEVIGGSKPSWKKTLSNCIIPQGKSLVLECEADGNPEPTCRWLRNGREILLTPGGRIKCESNNGTFRLTITDSSHNDEGDYTCEAINSLGQIRTTAALKIGTPPRIERIPTDLYLAENESSKIKVYYSGDQPIVCTLRHNGRELVDSPSSRITVFDDYIAILLKDITKGNAGQYEVDLKNDSGSAVGHFNVNITGLPGPPTGPLGITDITKHSCTLAWKPPTYDGGLKITNYVIERKDVSHDNWIVISSFCKDLTYTIQGLQENQEYLFRVMAVNDNGVGPPLAGINPIRAKAPFDVPSAPGKSTNLLFIYFIWLIHIYNLSKT